MSRPTVLVSAAVLIDHARNILLTQRPEGRPYAGLWEFPGGKVETGESPEEALVRELREELGITVKIEDLIAFRFVSHAYEDFHLVMVVFTVRSWEGEITPMEGQNSKWVKPQELLKVPTLPADHSLFELLSMRSDAIFSPTTLA